MAMTRGLVLASWMTLREEKSDSLPGLRERRQKVSPMARGRRMQLQRVPQTSRPCLEFEHPLERLFLDIQALWIPVVLKKRTAQMMAHFQFSACQRQSPSSSQQANKFVRR